MTVSQNFHRKKPEEWSKYEIQKKERKKFNKTKNDMATTKTRNQTHNRWQANLMPKDLSYPSLRSERERSWLSPVTWLQDKFNSEGGVLCLWILFLVHQMIASVRKSKLDLLTLQL